MDSRAFGVSLAYVNAMVDDPQQEDNNAPFDEKTVRELSQNALESFYPTFIQSYLRNLDINQILTSMYFITKQFGDTAPQDSLEKVLTPFKIKILNAIGDAAMLEKGSLLDKITGYFKENPTSSEEDISGYVQKELGVIKNNLKRTAPKLERIIDQY